LAAGAGDGTVKVWDVETGEKVKTLVGHTDWVESVIFAPDGSLIASASSDGTVKVWDVATGEMVETLVEHPGWWVHAVVFAPDGTLLTFDPLEGTVRVWDVETGGKVKTRGRFTEWSSSMTFSPDGSLIASNSYDGAIKIWDIATGGRVETLVGHTDWISSVAFSPDGSLIASASYDGTVKVWDIPEWTQPRPQTIVKISGDDQQGTANEPLANPLIVEVRDQHGAPLQGIQVTFTVTRGDGRLTIDNTTTDTNGRAQSVLTLGPDPGTNIVLVSVERLVPEIFNALGRPPIATLINDTLTYFSLFADAFGSSDLRFDLDANGTVDFADFFLFAEAANESERDQLFALAKELIGLPESAQLYQNAPNPFNCLTIFSYFLRTPGPTRLEVFTLTGQRVAVLSTGQQQAGRHRLAWDGRDNEGRPLASGVYLYRLVSVEGVLTRKLILLR
ncbi:MAG: T9SS type A sorting domain-containing protein, partial [Gemmatimonadetes bacterium]|nr:T9SS type A sorting domain-containing protein [Gemmatimonadota bacterium]